MPALSMLILWTGYSAFAYGLANIRQCNVGWATISIPKGMLGLNKAGYTGCGGSTTTTTTPPTIAPAKTTPSGGGRPANNAAFAPVPVTNQATSSQGAANRTGFLGH